MAVKKATIAAVISSEKVLLQAATAAGCGGSNSFPNSGNGEQAQ
jgi:hypothetical protein